MASKATLKQVKETKSLAAATATFAAEAGASMDEFWLSIITPDQSLPLSDEERIVALGRWLERESEREVAADRRLAATLRERHRMVRENARFSKTLRAKLLFLRQHVEGTYGPDQAFILLGLGPDLTEDPLDLALIGREVVNELTAPDFVFPEPRLQGQPADPAALVAGILPELENVEATRDAVDSEKRGSQRALKHKRQAAAAHTFALGHAARYLEALFFLCGEAFLAERLRLSSHIAAAEARRRKEQEKAAETGEEPDEEEPGEDEPGEDGAGEGGSESSGDDQQPPAAADQAG